MIKWVHHGIIALFLFTIGQHIWAATNGIDIRATYSKLTWTAPTTRTDGVPFDIVAEGGKYKLTWTRGAQTGTIELPATAKEYSILNFKANTSFTIIACDDLESCSAQSNTVVKPGGPPLAPNLTGVQ